MAASARPAGSPVYLSGRRLALARAAWLLIFIAGTALFLVGVPLHYQQLQTPCLGDGCELVQLTAEEMQALGEAGITPSAYAAYIVGLSVLVAVVYCAVGLVIFWRQSRERVALLTSLWLVTLGLTLFEGEVRAAAAAYPWLEAPVIALIWLGGVILLALFLFTFPDGRFVPGWTRWVYPVTVAVFVVMIVFELGGTSLWGLMILGGIAAQAYRYRRVSGPVQRQQTKWVMVGFLFLAVAIGALLLGGAFVDNRWTAVDTTLAALGFVAIPITVGFSVLRYRLWDTDRLINRTLVYGLLTAVLAGLYFSSVVVLQQLIQAVSGQRSPLAIVASTLLIAALFSPLQRRVQALIDRRFYRRRYDAARTLERFAAAARDEVDLQHLAAELISAVEQTMQPAGLQLWLKEPEE